MASSTRSFSSLCIFCGSSLGSKESFAAASKELAELMLAKNINLVYGGGNVGIMGLVASTIESGNGGILGIIPKALSPKECSGRMIGQVIVVEDMHARKALMAKNSDGFIALPGGFGTFEEILEVISWSTLGIHSKPIGILNIDGFYDPLIAMFDNGFEYGFIKPSLRGLIVVASGPQELLEKMQAYVKPEGAFNWFGVEDTYENI
eukprot:TRINITY_DN11594_c0_g1_i1.p2 TRINITY_DN11594_c0_g1~~TRINITY_DN11594_c0_g1_i1.p2  ORF type:complete len:206 (+),score=66.26 TRINITY_DN11594_c0_g1_i1:331-948(+)